MQLQPISRIAPFVADAPYADFALRLGLLIRRLEPDDRAAPAAHFIALPRRERSPSAMRAGAALALAAPSRRPANWTGAHRCRSETKATFTTNPATESEMHISPRPLRLPLEEVSAPSRTGSRPLMAFLFCAALTLGGVFLLSAYEIAPPTACGEDPAAACAVLK